MSERIEATGTAIFSNCRQYRYRLTRSWDHTLPKLVWVMLNPSTATAVEDDPTIRRCMRFSRDNGYGGAYMLNIFALRSTDPKKLWAHGDPIGRECDEWIVRTVGSYRRTAVVCAWGTQSHPLHRRRAAHVLELLTNLQCDTRCLGETKNGSPRHPLYVRADRGFDAYPSDGVGETKRGAAS